MSIVIDHLVKRFGGHVVVNNVTLEVPEGEFFVLLGPSGSGKSTLLRMIAGLTEIDHGTVKLHGRDVTRMSPQSRGVGFVFQHYALFRHMSVAQNIEFALRIRRTPAAEIRRRRDELLELVGLDGLGGRRAQQLSGGQQQRVAIARALAHQPDVLLLDEPFGALDARIRTELRRTIRGIQRELKVTTVFVTHDQEEAFELADRMGVMNVGRLLEVGPPEELYLRPQTEFVATFLGTANLMVGECTPSGVRVGPVEFPMSGAQASEAGDARRVQVLFRPEDVAVKSTAEALEWPLLGEATVEENGFIGSFERLRLRLPKLPGVRSIAPPAAFGGNVFMIEASRSQHQARRYPLRPGERAWVGVRRIHALTHPGLSFLLMTDGTPPARAAVDLVGEISKLAHARLTILGHGMEARDADAHLQSAKESIGSSLPALDLRRVDEPPARAVGSETARQHFDLLALSRNIAMDAAEIEPLLRTGDQHLLVVSGPSKVPARALICVAIGEPGKQDVLFAGRLIRHLGAQATILSVLPDDAGPRDKEHAARFLEAGARTLSLLDVPSATAIRTGVAREQILAELAEGGHDLLVMGAPLRDARGRMGLHGLVREVLTESAHPVLIVRSPGSLT